MLPDRKRLLSNVKSVGLYLKGWQRKKDITESKEKRERFVEKNVSDDGLEENRLEMEK